MEEKEVGGEDLVHSDRRTLCGLAQDLDCPVLVVHGDRDKITPLRDGRALARLGDGRLELVRGAGHFPHARKPVQVNLALRDFSEDAFGRRRTPRDPTVYRPAGRPRALYISSPIGLGHALPPAVAISVSGSVSSAHSTPSSMPLVECDSGKHREMNHSANSG